MSLSEQEISRIVEQVLSSMQVDKGTATTSPLGSSAALKSSLGDGVFTDIDSAVNAASTAQKQFVKLETLYRNSQPLRRQSY